MIRCVIGKTASTGQAFTNGGFYYYKKHKKHINVLKGGGGGSGEPSLEALKKM